jgi:hypothetical protein
MEQRSTRWRWIAVLALIIPALIGLIALVMTSSGSSETLGPVRGLRLGTTPVMARRHLTTGGQGEWATTASGEDYALTWTAESPTSDLRRAELEFHLGQLVAVRLLLSPGAPEADGPDLSVSQASVLTRETTPEGVSLVWLARSCPTHADEVRRRIAEHR